jgi:hypothetical protein
VILVHGYFEGATRHCLSARFALRFKGKPDLPFRDTRMETFIVSSSLYVQELGVRPRFLCCHEGSFRSQDCQEPLVVFG